MNVDELVAFVKETQGVLTWDTQSLIRIGGILAVKINAIQGMSGTEKQKLVLQILKLVLTELQQKEKVNKEAEERYEHLKRMVDEVVPASLELAVSAARGKLNLRKIKPSVWVRYCSCFAETVVSALASQKLISEAQARQALSAIDVVEEKAAVAAAIADAKMEEKGGLELRIPDATTQENPMLAGHPKPEEKGESETKSA
jgi:hypothetical protein